MKAAVLLSGSGTTLENIFERIDDGTLPEVEIAVVVASRADAFGLERARRRGVPAFVVPRKGFATLDDYTRAVFEPIRDAGAEFAIMAGFMVMVGVPTDFRQKVLNIHPALLPAFGGKGMYGHHVHEAVLAHGVKITGCTAHFVDDEYDRGPIIAQRAVDVREDDTPDSLAERVQAAEREVYPEAIRLFVAKRLKIEGRRVRVLVGPSSTA